MKFKLLIVLFLMCLISGCGNSEKERACWLDRCQKSGFTSQQCVFLLSVKEQGDSDTNDAAFAGAATAIATNMAVNNMMIASRR